MNQTSQNRYSLIVKKDCPTCTLLQPVMAELAKKFQDKLSIYVQDDPSFPENVPGCIDDSSLEFSYRNKIEIVPTLIKFVGSQEQGRIEGWNKQEWQAFTALENLGAELVDSKPGCGSKSLDPGMPEELALRFDPEALHSRHVELASAEDEIEACFDRDWSDGLPIIPPTPRRVLAMLQSGNRAGDEIVGEIPPNKARCSIEKLAINAVMAGCKPEYFPTVIAAIEAALQDRFCMHGLLCTTYFSSPVIVVNGPVVRHVGMNCGVNALGQGNRANATIGRALQLVIRNVGGGKPGGIDRATLGNPGKYSFCFAEDESDKQWPSLAMDQGYSREDSVLSLFAGDGVQPIMDQQSRDPESLSKSLAMSLRSVAHTKLYGMADAMLVISPEHRRVIQEHGWSKTNFKSALYEALQTPGSTVVRGAQGIAEGMPEKLREQTLDKFRDGGLHIVSAGGSAGMFSAIISGWVASGEKGSQLVSQVIN